jgi:hypothetical protein
MKKILTIVILLSSFTLFGKEKVNYLNNSQISIIQKIILNESFLDKQRYESFWLNSSFKKNDNISEKLLKKYNDIYELKLELWRSAKISYKYLDIIKTKKLEKIYHTLTDDDKENIFNILLAAKIHDDVNIVNNKKVHFNLLFIENMLQKQKNILVAINQLFDPKFSCSFNLSDLYSKYSVINVCPTVGYEYFSGGLFKKYVFRENETMVSFNTIKENINLDTCINIIANNFYLNNLTAKEIIEHEFFRLIEKEKYIFGKCIQNNDGTLMFYLYGKKKKIKETINIMKK